MDPHLNLFVSYNHDFVEDNLTRSFILTLKLLPNKIQRTLLKNIFKRSEYFNPILRDECLNLKMNQLDFALQGNIHQARSDLFKIPRKFILTITGENRIE